MLNPDLDPNPATSAVERIKGVWRLVAFDVEDQSTGARRPAFGTAPKGRLVMHSSGTLIVVITTRDRQPPLTPEDRVAAFDSTIAYSGRFGIQGDQLTTTVDIAWNEALCLTPRTDTWRLVGKRLELASAWRPSPADANRTIRELLSWERET